MNVALYNFQLEISFLVRDFLFSLDRSLRLSPVFTGMTF